MCSTIVLGQNVPTRDPQLLLLFRVYRFGGHRDKDFFGELGVIDGQPRTADVVAVTETKCWIMSQWAMKSVIANHPEVALSMLEELARRLRATDAKQVND